MFKYLGHSLCSWDSIASTYPITYTGALSNYKSHRKEVHADVKKVEYFSSKSKYSTEFNQATMMCSFEACNYNGLADFLPVPFFRAPCPKRTASWPYKLEQYPVCTVGDFKPYGLEVNNCTLIGDLQNIGCKALKLFSYANLKVIPSRKRN